MARGNKLMGIPQLLQFNTLLMLAALFLAIIASQVLSANFVGNGILFSAFILLLALGLLVVSADFFIEGAKGLARRGGIPEVVIGLTIVSIGTSLPEILVTSTSALNVDKNSTFVDVGSNFGIASIYASMSKSCQVLSFEPHYGSYYIQYRNIFGNNLQDNIFLFQIALSSGDAIGNNFKITDACSGRALNTHILTNSSNSAPNKLSEEVEALKANRYGKSSSSNSKQAAIMSTAQILILAAGGGGY